MIRLYGRGLPTGFHFGKETKANSRVGVETTEEVSWELREWVEVMEAPDPMPEEEWW